MSLRTFQVERLVFGLLKEFPETIVSNGVESSLRTGLEGTPNRVARMYGELLQGYSESGEEVLKAQFSDETIATYHGMVIVRGIPVFSLCEHHLLPFYGEANIGYIPGNGKVVGLSKLSRLVEVYSRRLQVQERLTEQVADDLEEYLEPKGVIVTINAVHMCMVMRGVRSHGADTVTSSLKGVFEFEPETRAEFFSLLHQ